MHLLRFGQERPRTRIEPLADGARLHVVRAHGFSQSIRLGPNVWHALVIHPDGSIDDLGSSVNLLTNTGRDLWDAGFGAAGVNNGANVATGSSATSLTDTGEAWTTDQFKGWTVIAEETTNTPVFGNIGSNSATVLTIDAWRNADDSAGTTPGTTANYSIYPTIRPRYMALTENAGAAAATDTALTGELTTGGCSRALATYAHTGGTSTYTMAKTFSVTASFPAIHKGALFTASNTTAAGVMPFEAVLNADANVINGDSLAVTATVTTTG
jgi:hypothetical protein